MEAILKENKIEADITRESCVNKRNSFFNCVVDKKNELTKTIENKDWKNYNHKVNMIAFNCFEENGLKKCENYFSLFDINY